MLGKVYLKTETMIRGGEALNKSEVAEKIGLDPKDLYYFFAGNRTIKADKLQVIADYFKVSFDDVKKEHEENIQRYIAKV